MYIVITDVTFKQTFENFAYDLQRFVHCTYRLIIK